MVLLNSASAAALLLLAAAADGYVSRGVGSGLISPSFLGGPASSSSSRVVGSPRSDAISPLPRSAGGVGLSMGFVEEFMSGRSERRMAEHPENTTTIPI